jgi:hypothetical protein
MDGCIISLIILNVVAAGLAIKLVLQDNRIEQLEGYIRRLEREKMVRSG